MKKIASLALGVLLVASTSYAKDIGAGTIEIDGGTRGSFSSTTYNDSDATVSTFNVGVGGLYYAVPNLGIGVMFDYTKLGGDADASQMQVGPQAAYNISISELMNLIVVGTAGFLSASADDEDATGWYAGGGVGIRYFLSDNFSVDCGVTFSHAGGDADQNTFGASFGLAIFLL